MVIPNAVRGLYRDDRNGHGDPQAGDSRVHPVQSCNPVLPLAVSGRCPADASPGLNDASRAAVPRKRGSSRNSGTLVNRPVATQHIGHGNSNRGCRVRPWSFFPWQSYRSDRPDREAGPDRDAKDSSLRSERHLRARADDTGPLTSTVRPRILPGATIRAQPLEIAPQPRSCVRQRGAHSRIRIVVCPLCSPRCAAGGLPVVHPKET
jgi:hypothetical protein